MLADVLSLGGLVLGQKRSELSPNLDQFGMKKIAAFVPYAASEGTRLRESFFRVCDFDDNLSFAQCPSLRSNDGLSRERQIVDQSLRENLLFTCEFRAL